MFVFKNRSLIPLATTLLFATCGLVFLYLSTAQPYGDFANFYYGDFLLRKGISFEKIYEPYEFNLAIKAITDKQVFANYSTVPPTTLFLFFPSLLFSIEYAKLVYGFVGLLLFCFACFRFLKTQEAYSYWWLLTPLLFLGPFKSNFYQGQFYLLILSLLILGYLSDRKNNSKTSALFFSIAISLKLFPAIILIYLAYEKKYQTIGYTVLFTFLLFLATLPILGTQVWTTFFFSDIPRLMNGELNNPFAVSYQSFAVLFKNLFLYDSLLNPSAEFPSSINYTCAIILFLLVSLGSGHSIFSSTKCSTAQKFGFSLFLCLFISGYGTVYSLILLFPLAVGILPVTNRSILFTLLIFGLLFLVLNLPIGWLSELSFYEQFVRAYAMLAILVVLLLLFGTSINLTSIGILFLVIAPIQFYKYHTSEVPYENYLSMGLPQQKKRTSNFLNTELLTFTYSYLPKDTLVLYSYNEKGAKKNSIYAPYKIDYSTELYIFQNQIYYKDIQLTNTNDRKQRPCFLDKKEILFLCDQGRGIGFYTLKKIPIPITIKNQVYGKE